MKILCVDASTNVASCAVISEEKLISESIVNYKLTHSKTLMPKIQDVMDDAGLGYKDLDALAVTIGPGSFTGLRIGLATVKGIAHAAKLPVIPVSTLEALAYNLSYANGILCPILDARRQQVYTGLFRVNGTGNVERLREDAALGADELLEILDQYDEPIYLLGDGCASYGDTLINGSPDRQVVSPAFRLGMAASLGEAALRHPDDATDFHEVAPVYLRASYAEENQNKTSGGKKHA